MAMSQAAALAEKAIGHDNNATTEQDVSNPNRDPKYADNSEKMLALAWMGKNKVEMSAYPHPTSPKPISLSRC